jgi:CRP-like cAMP-binding protein
VDRILRGHIAAKRLELLREVVSGLRRLAVLASDRTDNPKLPLTQDFISQMLAVRRTTVTVIAGKLQQAGLIRYHRGSIAIVDRLKLEEAACECYRTISRRTDAVFHPPQTALV